MLTCGFFLYSFYSVFISFDNAMVLSVDFSKCAATLDLNNLEVHTYDDQTKCRLDKDYSSKSKKQEAHGPHRSPEKSSNQ